MKTYKSSIQILFFSSIVFTIISAIQLTINIYYDRVLFIIIFLIAALGYLFYTIMLMIDLITKETKLLEVTIIEINAEIIKVLKANGKKRRIRVLRSEIDKYQVNEKLILTLTKRTRLIKEISLAN